MGKIRIGDAVVVPNTERVFGEAEEYVYMRAQLLSGEEQGGEVPLLFTSNEIENAAERAMRNAEDLPRVPFLQDLLD